MHFISIVCLAFVTIGITFRARVQGSPRCTGNPRMYHGKPCASTTQSMNDGHMGACGCGIGDTPFQWMIHGYTTAANSHFFDAGLAEWCGSACGKCVKLTTTGGYVQGGGGHTSEGQSITVIVTNLCPARDNPKWCAQPSSGGNTFGYKAHFELEDTNRQITHALNWNNSEVTYEIVNCDSVHDHLTPSSHDYDRCECTHQGK